MIIDQGDTADYESIRIFHGCGNQTIAYQVPEGFGTIGVALAGDEAVKAGQEIGINRDACPCQLSHELLLYHNLESAVTRYCLRCYAGLNRVESTACVHTSVSLGHAYS